MTASIGSEENIDYYSNRQAISYHAVARGMPMLKGARHWERPTSTA
jgi:hypothetical protein